MYTYDRNSGATRVVALAVYSLTMADRSSVYRYEDRIISDLRQLIAIPSVRGEAEPNAPYGVEPVRALEFVLDRGRSLGFATKNVANVAGHVEFGSTGPLISVLTHLDVVPAGDGWEHDPFGGTIEDGCVFGRGAADDKGPAIASLYVLKAFADEVPDPTARIRLIFGTNEESGMGGVRRYFESEELPDFGFSPDAGYPLYNREMGIVNISLSTRQSGRSIVTELSGGEALNMVANEARAKISPEWAELAGRVVTDVDEKGSVEHRLSIAEAGDSTIVHARGISAHGGRPAAGVNAISYLVDAISEIANAAELEEGESPDTFEPEIVALRRLIGYETRGDSLGIATRDMISGELSVNWGTMEIKNRKITVGLNIRYPVSADFNEISKALKRRAVRTGFTVSDDHHLEPLFIPEDSPLVHKLLSAYSTVTGEEAAPLSMSGGTYARMLGNRGVAFGAGFPGEIQNAHQPEEHISISSLMRHSEISLQALFELADVEGTK